MGCPPVRGDNPRALASGLSYVQVDKHGIIFYTTYISIDLAHHEIFHAKGGINLVRSYEPDYVYIILFACSGMRPVYPHSRPHILIRILFVPVQSYECRCTTVQP